MDILEVMKARHSVRQYKDTPISEEHRCIINEYVKTLNGKSGLNIQIIYDEPKCFDSFMAHYGKFNNVANYISIVGTKSKELEEQAGYYGEMLVLKAKEIGLDTCWVALTHGKSKAIVNKNEKEAIIIALGYGANNGVPHKNKPIETLAPNIDSKPEWFKLGVEGAMLAPTAVNQQKFLITLENDNAIIQAPKGILTKMDLGIVKCHFELASNHKVK